ncbi:cytosolic Fe-S cluster assembly factor NUBP2 homolog [Dysidea avara]|uniref:cytosolic Fe-S cluster assembly factor NUBP2 homolog n=1 Tax=Dysidea avara TaxID=196820 RepID=UPI00331AF66A
MESPAKHVILVLSGKGGVGKSTVATQLALSLVENKKKVGVLDVDLCGPSIPRMLNVEGQDVHQCPTGWVPVYTRADKMLSVMSIGFLLDHKDDAVVWRGPKKNAMIKQFLTDVVWEDLDYLIIDTPPGTSDEHISVVEGLKELTPDGAVVVTTPQGVALADVRRELSFCRKTSIKVLGVVENMSGYTCPHCSECTNLFSKGGGQALASEFQIPFLGQVPLDPRITQCSESGKSFMDSYKGTPTQEAMSNITKQLLTLCNDNS